MTDLTEQWQKGKLELDKNYYLELEDGTIEIQMYVGCFLCREDNGVKKVLSEVPTYQEYLALQSDSLAKNEGAEIIAELEAKVKKLKKDYKDLEYKFRSYKDFKETAYDLDTSRLEEENKELKERNNSLNNRDINLCRIANEIRNENFALKELLKECKHIMSIEKDFASCHFEKDKLCKLLTQINQALGEDK